jgi:hypothetical protein
MSKKPRKRGMLRLIGHDEKSDLFAMSFVSDDKTINVTLWSERGDLKSWFNTYERSVMEKGVSATSDGDRYLLTDKQHMQRFQNICGGMQMNLNHEHARSKDRG